MPRPCWTITADERVRERTKDACAALGWRVGWLIHRALLKELDRLEAEHGPFPQRPPGRLPDGRPPVAEMEAAMT
jgi:hypothetical protein